MKVRIIITGKKEEADEVEQLLHSIGFMHIEFRSEKRGSRINKKFLGPYKTVPVDTLKCHYCFKDIPEFRRGAYCCNSHAAKHYIENQKIEKSLTLDDKLKRIRLEIPIIRERPDFKRDFQN